MPDARVQPLGQHIAKYNFSGNKLVFCYLFSADITHGEFGVELTRITAK